MERIKPILFIAVPTLSNTAYKDIIESFRGSDISNDYYMLMIEGNDKVEAKLLYDADITDVTMKELEELILSKI